MLQRLLPLVAAIILSWTLVLLQTYYHWGSESYYNFGTYVPFLALGLFWFAFKDLKPDPHPATWLFGLAVLFILPAFPAFALSEVNPFWRVPLWVMGLCAWGFSSTILYILFGYQGFRRSLFPFFFLLTMIPWPYRLEVIIVQTLTGIVVSIAMQLLHFVGYPVTLAGNSFALGEIAIGVNEACSGIRSFQALFMVSLFLGSVFGHSYLQRIIVLLLLPFVVIVINAFRATFLAIVVIEDGQAAYDKWHDPAGYIAFIVSMALIYGLIELTGMILKKKKHPDSSSQTEQPANTQNTSRSLPAPLKTSLLAALPALVFLSSEGWFRFHERNTPPAPSWSLSLPPKDAASMQVLDIHPTIENLLGYDYATRFIHKLDNDTVLEVYFYGYLASNKLSSVSSYGHSPTICMEASGASLVSRFPQLDLNLDGIQIPLQHFLFKAPNDETPLNVFWVVWENRNMATDPNKLASLNYLQQFRQLLRGRRDFSRHVFLASVYSNQPPEAARQAIVRFLNAHIAPNTPPQTILAHTNHP